jgi:membrane protein YqaA with SNARE-associated domain
MTTLAKTMRNAVMAGALLASLTLLTGCDLAGLAGLSNLASTLGGLGGWDTGYYFPASTLYDPTGDIQSVNAYRQEVYDNSNDAWDAYIRE